MSREAKEEKKMEDIKRLLTAIFNHLTYNKSDEVVLRKDGSWDIRKGEKASYNTMILTTESFAHIPTNTLRHVVNDFLNTEEQK